VNFLSGLSSALITGAEDWGWKAKKEQRGDWMIFVKRKSVLTDGRRKKAGSESRVEVLIFHVKAARGTKERLAGAVCALTFQAFR